MCWVKRSKDFLHSTIDYVIIFEITSLQCIGSYIVYIHVLCTYVCYIVSGGIYDCVYVHVCVWLTRFLRPY